MHDPGTVAAFDVTGPDITFSRFDLFEADKTAFVAISVIAAESWHGVSAIVSLGHCRTSSKILDERLTVTNRFKLFRLGPSVP